MLVMAVLLLAGTTFLTISSTETQIALNQQVSAQAFFLAQTGIQQAIAQLNANSAYTGGTYAVAGGGSYTVTVTAATVQTCPRNNAMDVDVIARVPVGLGQAQTELKTTVDRVSYPFQWAAYGTENLYLISYQNKGRTDSFDSTLGAYGGTLGTTQSWTLSSATGCKPSTSGGTNVACNGDIGAGSGANLLLYDMDTYGDVQASTTINTAYGSTVSGAQVTSMPQLSLPSVVPPSTPTSCASLSLTSGSSQILATGCYTTTGGINLSSNSSTSITASGGPLSIVTSSMTVNSNATLTTSGGPVTIYVAGNMTVNGNATFTTSVGPVTIYVAGNMTVNNNLTLTATGNPPLTNYSPLIIYPPLTIYVAGTGNVGDTVTLGTVNGSLTLITNSNLSTGMSTLTVGDNFVLYGAIFGTNTRILFGERATIYGSIIVQQAFGNWSYPWNNRPPTIHYDHAMAQRPLCHGGNYAVRHGTWREVTP
jgi:hypothetical protein